MSALSPQTLLVTGASGHLGQGVVRHPLDTLGVPHGRIVATTRRPERLSAFALRRIELRRRGRAQRIHDVHWLADRDALFNLLKTCWKTPSSTRHRALK